MTQHVERATPTASGTGRSAAQRAIVHRLGHLMMRHRDLAGTAAVFLAFFFLYRAVGLRLVGVESRFEFFGSDVDNWFGLARDAEPRHPLIPLFIAPLVPLIRYAVVGPAQEAVFLNALFGATAVALACQVFRRLLVGAVESILLTLLFGLSMNQVMAGSVPETYALSACAITGTYLLFLASLRRRGVNMLAWTTTALVALGVTVSTVPQVGVTFLLAMHTARIPRWF